MNAGGHAALTLLQAVAACARAPLDSLRDGDRLRADGILSSKASMERLLRATINTWHGLLAAARSEEAFRQELIARVKDMGSAAVGLALLMAAATWLLALAERLGLI